MCNRTTPSPFKILRVRGGGGGITHARLFFLFLLPFCIPLPPIGLLTLQDLEGEGGGAITYARLFFLPHPCFIPLPLGYPVTLTPSPPTLTLQDLLLPSPK